MSAKEGLIRLGRLADRDPQKADKLRWALELDLPNLIEPAIEATRETGYPVSEILRKLIAGQIDATLDNRVWQIGESYLGSNTLMPILAEVGLRKLCREPEGTPEIRQLCTDCVIILLGMGLSREAVPFCEQSAEAWRVYGGYYPEHGSI